jgi:hypothetical protein
MRKFEIIETTHGFEILRFGQPVPFHTWTTRAQAERDVAEMESVDRLADRQESRFA